MTTVPMETPERSIGGLAPQTQQQLMAKALAENWETDVFSAALKKHSWRRLT